METETKLRILTRNINSWHLVNLPSPADAADESILLVVHAEVQLHALLVLVLHGADHAAERAAAIGVVHDESLLVPRYQVAPEHIV